MQRLIAAYNPTAAAGVMCRYTLSIGWDGTIYDCDFNQMLDLPVDRAAPQTIETLAEGVTGPMHTEVLAALHGRRVVTGPHCYGCTAGAGSSCGGATVA
jgi:hypothetical protein